ncbi:MAG: excinuclease ABC subunit UvrC [Candidatus Gracilibacteria bacterium]|nr:excinuclease ABC subunit UvrC [Candidatus Gracilibacteria bacterium]
MQNLTETLRNIPKLPGVYQYFNKTGKIIYIGKSVSLYSRVNSYFNGKSKLNFAKKKMVDEIDKIEIIITNTAIESLLLETNLIKKYKPKYNILMKDDKNHTYIKITDEIFPKVIKTRIKTKFGEYFGPYTSSNYVNNITKITKKIFGHRSCNIVFKKENGIEKIKSTNGSKIPCIDYYIGRCAGPCLLKEENIKKYNEDIKNIRNFLSGDFKQVIEDLKIKMQKYATNLNFEKAGELKQDLASIEILNQNQIIRDVVGFDADIINFLEKYDKFYISKIEVRGEKITGIYNFEIENKLQDLDDSIKYFIENNYLENTSKLTLILPHKINLDKEILQELKLKIEIPQIGEKTQILNLAYKNAFEFAYKTHLEGLSVKGFTKKDMLELLNILGYKQVNEDIIFECNDISHISGNHTVASRSIIENGKVELAKYKKFKIKTLQNGEINDFDSMREIMTRRIAEIKKTGFIPDLIIIDGGKGQLSSVVEIVKKDGVELQLVSLAKREEELFLPGKSQSIILDKNSNILRMIQKIRDEAHRFAITFNRDSRIKASKKNILEELPGIGSKTRSKLLKHYGSIDNIQNDEQLKKILKKSQIETLENHGII